MDFDKFVTGLEEDLLVKLEVEMGKYLIIMEDLNADVIAPKQFKYTKKLISITQLHRLSQLIKELTYVTEHSSTAIVLVFVNNLHHFELVIIQLCSPSRKLEFVNHP